RADLAMYQAKKAGRGRFSYFSKEMNRLAQERLMLENALRQALQEEDESLTLHYQPQIEMKTGFLYGVEALARWRHPTLGPISPARFIPLAEECGLIGMLGQWALKEACRQLKEWRYHGLQVPSISVNMSPSNFHDLNLPRMIADTLRRNALKPSDLTLELTESILLDTNPSTMKTIETMHAQGIRLSMDDFSSGYSSLSSLRSLPVSELKLDRCFVADLETDAAARALSSAILGIGNSLSLVVVAEGVETELQKETLRKQGYPVVQGYLFSRPLTPVDFERWLRESGLKDCVRHCNHESSRLPPASAITAHQAGVFQTTSISSPATASSMSVGPRIVPVQTGSYRVAARMPTTAAPAIPPRGCMTAPR